MAGTRDVPRSGSAPTGTDGPLRRWVEAGLITGEQADAIATFEASHGEAPARRTPLVTEALAYLGAALALAAGLVALGRVWDDVSSGMRVTWLALGAVAAFAGGAVVRSDDPAIRRVGSVLWFVAAGLVDAAAAVFVFDVLGWERPEGVVWAFATGSVVATGLYVARRRALQQVALFGSLVTAVGAASMWAVQSTEGTSSEAEATVVGYTILAAGMIWLGLAWFGTVTPERTGFTLGSAAGLIGPWVAIGQDNLLAPVLGLVFALGLLAGSVIRRSNVLLGLGAAGTFLMLVRLIVQLFEDTLGVPIALLMSGVVLLVVALGTARLRRAVGSGA